MHGSIQITRSNNVHETNDLYVFINFTFIYLQPCATWDVGLLIENDTCKFALVKFSLIIIKMISLRCIENVENTSKMIIP
jgi:hypothetical protein